MAERKQAANSDEAAGNDQWFGWHFLGSLSSHYPVLLVAAICFNLGYLSFFDADAITLLNVWDHLAMFIKSALWISVSLFLFVQFILYATMAGQLSRRQKTAKSTESVSIEAPEYEIKRQLIDLIPGTIFVLFVIVAGVIFLNEVLAGTIALVGAFAFASGQVVGDRDSAEKAALRRYVLGMAAIAMIPLLFGAGQLKARFEASAAPSSIATIDGTKTRVHLIAALHSGVLVYGGSGLQWIESKRLTAVSFVAIPAPKPTAASRPPQRPLSSPASPPPKPSAGRAS